MQRAYEIALEIAPELENYPSIYKEMNGEQWHEINYFMKKVLKTKHALNCSMNKNLKPTQRPQPPLLGFIFWSNHMKPNSGNYNPSPVYLRSLIEQTGAITA